MMLLPPAITMLAIFSSALGAEVAPCAGLLLENGICLPPAWPPRANFSAELKTPPYLLQPPALINISRGRQLFVDTFLIAETNAATSFHEGEYAAENPVLRPDQEWEKTPKPPGKSSPWGDGGGGIAMPFRGINVVLMLTPRSTTRTT